jgi:recombinational DNA repair ATPase RecF
MPISSLPTQTVEQLSSRLRAKQSAGQFREFIDYVRFPRYRNIEDNAKINFDFPITALVGPNGGGKTSLLQAI